MARFGWVQVLSGLPRLVCAQTSPTVDSQRESFVHDRGQALALRHVFPAEPRSQQSSPLVVSH
jgi:hypothetical protein